MSYSEKIINTASSLKVVSKHSKCEKRIDFAKVALQDRLMDLLANGMTYSIKNS